MDKEHGEKFNVDLVRAGIVVALVAVLAFFGGVSVGAKSTPAFGQIPFLGDNLDATPDPSVNLTEFWKAWNVLSTRFVQTHASSSMPKSKEVLWGAIEGLVESYGDPYTVFMRPEESKLFAENIAGNFSGVGMEIGVKDDVITVIAPLKGTPAERAGIRAGDKIIAIDATSTASMGTDEAVKLIRGKKGTPVTFTVVREGEVEELEIVVVRDIIQVPTIDTKLDAENNVYTISLYSFTANSGSLFANALSDFRKSGSHRLIIDLRGNPGGYLEAAVDMASHFLPQGTTIVTEDYKGHRENIVHESRGTGGIPEGTQIVILMDQGSASASEIFAGALQDNKVATLVGTRSFGKGSVQELIDIDGGSLKVTIAKWLTPSGRSISDGGLTADIEVERTEEDFKAEKDPQKDRATSFLVKGK